MKIKIQTESGEKERNWYICDLDCYTPEFLQQIILSLFYEENNQSQDTKPPITIGENRLGARDKTPDTNNSTKQELNKEIAKDWEQSNNE